VDPGQLSQVIHNLTINAVQAMPDGGRVSISARNHLLSAGSVLPLPPGPYLLIAVADTGPGIPPHLHQRVFDPYYTTKKKGSGLGLSIVHSIVTKHDGHISVESRPGAGTRFLIHLPASLQAAAPEEPPVGSLIGGTGRLLVMDDDEGVLEASEQLLAHLGFSVTAVRSGAEAIEAYRQAVAADEPFEAVILDLTVPGGMGGAETVRRLARLDPNVRALASSGYSSDPIMANFRSFGFVGALPKPYTLAELSRALCTLGPVPARSPGGDEK
jgi:CheY-like chemotaxis protein